MRSFGPDARATPARILANTPVVVGLTNGVVGGVLTGLIAKLANTPTLGSIVLGIAATRLLVSRFPSTPPDDAGGSTAAAE
jgi:hypothetical protein